MVRASLPPTPQANSPAPVPRDERPVSPATASRHARAATAPRPAPFTVLIDNREGAPFSFRGIVREGHPLIVPIRRVYLPTGDYSACGEVVGPDGRVRTIDLRDRVVIERKSLEDLFGSLAGKEGKRRERFAAEHERMRDMIAFGGFAHVVIEASRDDARNRPPGFGAHPHSVLSCSVSWPRRYGVPWHWDGSRNEAEQHAYELLADAWRQLVEKVGRTEGTNEGANKGANE